MNADLHGDLGKSHVKLCHETLRELVIEQREYAKLLGDIRSDGSRIKGEIEQRLKLVKLADQDEFLRIITIQAAAIADESGRTTDAVLLYHLAEDYDNVVVIINRALSDAVAVDLGGNPIKLQPLKPRGVPGQNGQQEQFEPGSSLSLTSVDDPVILAKNMIGVYNQNALYYQKIRQGNRDTCGSLMRMMEAKAQIETGETAKAVDVSPPFRNRLKSNTNKQFPQTIDALGILPVRAKGSVPYIRNLAHSFSILPPDISRNVGQLLLWAIACISNERDGLRTAGFETDVKQTMARDLEAMARDLMVFAGMIKYKLSPRVFETLARAGGDIGAY